MNLKVCYQTVLFCLDSVLFGVTILKDKRSAWSVVFFLWSLKCFTAYAVEES